MISTNNIDTYTYQDQIKCLEVENELLRDMLNKICWNLGLDGKDVPESQRCHFYDIDNYTDCIDVVLNKIEDMKDKIGVGEITNDSDVRIVPGNIYTITNHELVRVNYVYLSDNTCEVEHLDTGDVFTIGINSLNRVNVE